MKYEIIHQPRAGGKTVLRQTVEAGSVVEAAERIHNEFPIGYIVAVIDFGDLLKVNSELIGMVLEHVEWTAIREGWRSIGD